MQGLSTYFGRQLFDDTVSYASLASLIARGAEIHTTQLSESFDFAALPRDDDLADKNHTAPGYQKKQIPCR